MREDSKYSRSACPVGLQLAQASACADDLAQADACASGGTPLEPSDYGQHLFIFRLRIAGIARLLDQLLLVF